MTTQGDSHGLARRLESLAPPYRARMFNGRLSAAAKKASHDGAGVLNHDDLTERVISAAILRARHPDEATKLESLGNVLRIARYNCDLARNQVARSAGIDVSFLAALEQGFVDTSEVSTELLGDLSAVLMLPPALLTSTLTGRADQGHVTASIALEHSLERRSRDMIAHMRYWLMRIANRMRRSMMMIMVTVAALALVAMVLTSHMNP